MTDLARPAVLPAPSPRAELAGIVLLVWAGLAAIPLGLGEIAFSWDALNHHMYLGWIAFSPRFDRDFVAAGYQAYQYPYLYWPAYQLAALGVPGMWAGVILDSLYVTAVPALWLLARACVPQAGWEGVLLRAGAVVLAFLAQLPLSLMDVTANDLLAAIPLVWAVALAIVAMEARDTRGWFTPARLVALSGFAAGLAVAAKFSNGPIGLLLPLLWVLPPGTWLGRLGNVVRGGLWSMAGFLLAYGFWGWQLWEHFGNPMYPFYDYYFGFLRAAVGWQQP
jgi:hypothetical protein